MTTVEFGQMPEEARAEAIKMEAEKIKDECDRLLTRGQRVFISIRKGIDAENGNWDEGKKILPSKERELEWNPNFSGKVDGDVAKELGKLYEVDLENYYQLTDEGGGKDIIHDRIYPTNDKEIFFREQMYRAGDNRIPELFIDEKGTPLQPDLRDGAEAIIEINLLRLGRDASPDRNPIYEKVIADKES